MIKPEPIIEFHPKLPELTGKQKAVLKLLVEAGRLIVPVYLEQEKQLEKGGNFYPKGVSQEEIEEAAKDDPEILSHFTVVEKIDGKLTATSYHVKYAKLLRPIANKLNEASKLTENKEFGKLLRLQANALIDGSYNKATIAWLKNKRPYILDISIGPIKHFSGQLLFGKASYQAWVGVLDKESSNEFNEYKNITLSIRRKNKLVAERIENYERVKTKVLDTVIFSGFMARTKFVGLHLPTDISVVEKYGAEAILFNQPNDVRLKEQILPIFNRFFPREFKQGFVLEDLRKGYLRAVGLHELAHNYLYYKHASKRLLELFPVIEELAATILGLRIAGRLLLKDVINNKQLESMIITFLCRSFYHKEVKSLPSHPLRNYAAGGTIFINFMLENGALKLSRGFAVPNFVKIFLSLQELLDILERLLSIGTYEEARMFVKKYT